MGIKAMQTEILFSGFGGQGVMFAGQLLAYAAMDSGLQVTWIPSYGPEMRGGTAHCFVTISSRPIGSPVVTHPTIGVVFNNPSFDKYAAQVAQGGLLVVNSSLIDRRCTRDDITTIYVPATSIADSLGEVRMTNMVLVGALLAARPVLPIETVQAALKAHLPAHRHRLLPVNLQALEKGAAFVGEKLLV